MGEVVGVSDSYEGFWRLHINYIDRRDDEQKVIDKLAGKSPAKKSSYNVKGCERGNDGWWKFDIVTDFYNPEIMMNKEEMENAVFISSCESVFIDILDVDMSMNLVSNYDTVMLGPHSIRIPNRSNIDFTIRIKEKCSGRYQA